MAVSKLVEKKYQSESDLRRLISYVYRNACYCTSPNMITKNEGIIAQQFLYIQACYGGELNTRARHWIVSFDSRDWEHWMKRDCVVRYALTMCDMIDFPPEEYQYFCVVHDNPDHIHIHVIINPVNWANLRIMHLSAGEWQYICRQLAEDLYMRCRVALQGVSYIDEQSRMKWGEDSSTMLYLDRDYYYDPLKKSKS